MRCSGNSWYDRQSPGEYDSHEGVARQLFHPSPSQNHSSQERLQIQDKERLSRTTSTVLVSQNTGPSTAGFYLKQGGRAAYVPSVQATSRDSSTDPIVIKSKKPLFSNASVPGLLSNISTTYVGGSLVGSDGQILGADNSPSLEMTFKKIVKVYSPAYDKIPSRSARAKPLENIIKSNTLPNSASKHGHTDKLTDAKPFINRLAVGKESPILTNTSRSSNGIQYATSMGTTLTPTTITSDIAVNINQGRSS